MRCARPRSSFRQLRPAGCPAVAFRLGASLARGPLRCGSPGNTRGGARGGPVWRPDDPRGILLRRDPTRRDPGPASFRTAGRIAAECREWAKTNIRPGVALREVLESVEAMIRERGAAPGFPAQSEPQLRGGALLLAPRATTSLRRKATASRSTSACTSTATSPTRRRRSISRPTGAGRALIEASARRARGGDRDRRRRRPGRRDRRARSSARSSPRATSPCAT